MSAWLHSDNTRNKALETHCLRIAKRVLSIISRSQAEVINMIRRYGVEWDNLTLVDIPWLVDQMEFTVMCQSISVV